MIHNAPNIFGYKKYWAHRFGPAPELPMTLAEMQQLGWDACDVILVTGDAYVDHPSFGMAVIGRVLEAQGFRVGIISQPDWHSAEDFRRLGQPKLFFGVTGGNMDSMVNRYTSDKKIRSNDAYTADGAAGKRPDRAVNVYAHRCREAYKNVPIVIGGIEASLRRIAHYDYWSDKVRKSILLDSKADLLVYGNAERQVVEIAQRLAKGETIADLKGIRGTVHFVKQIPQGWMEKDSTDIDKPGAVISHANPYQEMPACDSKSELAADEKVIQFKPIANKQRMQTVIRLPEYDAVKDDPILYAHASRVMHGETNPGNARALIQRHGNREVWINPPPLPLTTPEMDGVFDLPYSRLPHTHYGKANIPAFEMIQHSVLIMRGCFGGCSFCSITEHEGRIIQNRSEDSIIREIEAIRDTSPNFTGHISDLGGPTANMWRLACKDPKIEESCRKPSCVYPGICHNLNTDQTPLVKLYRRARKLPGIKKIFIASGLRYDIAVETPEYVKELVTHHVGGYLKIAPEHTEQGPLSKMMKPGMGTYDRFKQMFDKYSKEAGKEQYLIPYFIAAHPGTEDKDMLNLALWLKRNGFRADQVQAFLPSPMSIATAMYHSGKDTLHKVARNSPDIAIPKSIKQRRLHKAFLRYHDPKNWPLLREALKDMGRADLIGNGKQHLVPSFQPKTDDQAVKTRSKTTPFKTKYTGFPKKRSVR
ncbi:MULTISPECIES: YgiQ family radical SAM protein [Methylomonas]|uniref:YgiQ family radical SAM protein n=2 Tax=Methylomonas TaxID=416 RepID=A0A140E5M9_9GAMM|nr:MULTISPECIES: YgiQ family radical SAM protein [Methylomonas]AMK78703.1 YgiQ family radical SAM protein [Methylomonas denitrificans]OAI03699.1 radical SAM protein [Methylomonas methanica]TCV83544.1 putative radical SAM protein YgiQ [Methylomonas methanica]